MRACVRAHRYHFSSTLPYRLFTNTDTTVELLYGTDDFQSLKLIGPINVVYRWTNYKNTSLRKVHRLPNVTFFVLN